MMTEHRTSTDDPIGAYAREAPPIFSQIHIPEKNRINLEYIKSLPGIMKILTIVCEICILICGLSSGVCWQSATVTVWSDIIAGFGLMLTPILLTVYLLRFSETFSVRLPWWRLFEIIYLSAWSFWHLTIGISCAYYADKTCHWFPAIDNNPLVPPENYTHMYTGSSALAAASFFGFLAFLAYGADNFFTFAIWKAETRTSSTVANSDANEPNTAPA